ncbi:uncharacterized protein LOC142765907 [Rhipicephalus microplus]|uniref:uncharacterized protein LOC142765907 n=1 Tax=Rhipicephalus microplus TaxID=6941 RepID=UPI003F6A7E9F
MAAPAGPPGFDEEADNWEAYRLRLEAYFEVHDVTDEKKRRAILVTALSTKAVDLLAARCAPAKIQDLKYEDAVKFLGERFAPACNEIAESYKFFTRKQLAAESANEFLVEIRKIASRCNFGSALNRMLRDRIVCGLRDASVRRQLLAKAELTLREAEEAARAAEMTAANVDHMASAQNTGNVHAMTIEHRGQPTRHPSLRESASREDWRHEGTCPCCGKSGHTAEKCKFHSVKCFTCKRQGHLARVCQQHQSQQNKVFHCESQWSDNDDYEQFLLNLQVASVNMVQPIYRTMEWDGGALRMQVDTGSPVTIITWPTHTKYRHLWPRLQKTTLQLTCFLGQLPVKGQLNISMTYGGTTLDATLVVLGCSGPDLCWRDVIKALEQHGRQVLAVGMKAAPDHKPLLRLLSPDKPVPALAAARIQRWSLLLSGYTYTIEYKAGKTLPVADALSRLPCSSMPPAKEPVPWPETKEKWSRVHADYAGPVEGHMLLIVVDSHTK